MRSKQFIVLLVFVAVIGVVVSLASWGFLELIYQLQRELWTHLPHALGYSNGPPKWWSLPVLGIAATIVALTITRLPGNGGHLPAKGLASGGLPKTINLPGVVLAGLATIASGLVLGPEAPLIAIGAGAAVLMMRLARDDTTPSVLMIVGAAGSFAAVSLIFASPLAAAVLLIEASGIGGTRLPLVLVPGLLAAGIGSLISTGMGSWTGLSSKAFALGSLPLPAFDRPTVVDFAWTIALAIVVAIVARAIRLGGLGTYSIVKQRMLPLLPIVGLAVAGLAIAFSEATGKSVSEVLFSGQSALPGLLSNAGTWSLSALLLLIVFKGIAYSLSLGSFRGGPTFPAMFLGAAGGVMASHLAGFALTPAVTVGIAAGIVAVLRLPLSAVLIATLLSAKSGVGDEPLIIVGAVVAYVVTLVLSRADTVGDEAPDAGGDEAADAGGGAGAKAAPAGAAATS